MFNKTSKYFSFFNIKPPASWLGHITRNFLTCYSCLCYSSIDQPNNQSFSNKIEAVQYNAALAITNKIKGTSRTKLYNELGIEPLSFRWCFRHLCIFYKIKTQRAPEYLYKLISLKNNTYDTRSTHSVGTYCCRTNPFKYSFLLIPFKNATIN